MFDNLYIKCNIDELIAALQERKRSPNNKGKVMLFVNQNDNAIYLSDGTPSHEFNHIDAEIVE